VAPASCGEIRLIYRLTRTDVPLIGENAVSQRLPMTLNLVLKAKGEGNDASLSCREIAGAGWRPAIRRPWTDCSARTARSP